MTSRRIVVVTAGLGQPSSSRLLADRLAAATVTALREDGLTAEVEVIELREHARALADGLVTGFSTGALRAALDATVRADALGARVARAGGELAELLAARRAELAADPFADPVPFERLLAGG